MEIDKEVKNIALSLGRSKEVELFEKGYFPVTVEVYRRFLLRNDVVEFWVNWETKSFEVIKYKQ